MLSAYSTSHCFPVSAEKGAFSSSLSGRDKTILPRNIPVGTAAGRRREDNFFHGFRLTKSMLSRASLEEDNGCPFPRRPGSDPPTADCGTPARPAPLHSLLGPSLLPPPLAPSAFHYCRFGELGKVKILFLSPVAFEVSLSSSSQPRTKINQPGL